ncbi:hypothetical protein A2V80_03080 [Candidatus Woesebacteria bacterium RBG_16_39_8b]|uniref:50S ribosomal protein L29 n=1 Tax=Candidatus Woesebacteria bacterium RBG_16_39_8b TaxID=1802482 RepID=A0A1F7XCJ6_9BACT|nr:MAG: hypothetical protein A2V80_03080 [Candidatus Woesebacteria bacterium RBG_16_39_8b]
MIKYINMKKNDLLKLRGRKLTEIEDILKNKRLEFIRAKTNLKAKREKNLKKAKLLSREISQMLTIIKEKKLIEKIK